MDVEVEGAVTNRRIRRETTRARAAGAAGDGERHDADIGSFREVAVDFAAGCVSGCTGIVVGQPFDTVKVRLQTQDVLTLTGAGPARNQLPQFSKGAIECAVETVSKEGVPALFKGMGTPLASAALINAICFGAYAHSQRVLTAHGFIEDRAAVAAAGRGEAAAGEGGVGVGGVSVAMTESELERRKNSSLVWSFVGGSFAGLCQTVVVIPTETIKVKLQVQVGALGSNKLQYEGPIDCAVKVVRAEGLRSLFRGATATIYRETPSLGIYFASYEALKVWMEERWGFGEQASSCCAGGAAGALSWVSVYPFDVVKSIQQAATDPLDPSTRTMTACFRTVYAAAGGGVPGVRRFFRGLGTTLVRAVPVNAAIFPTFEWTVKVLNRAFPPKRQY